MSSALSGLFLWGLAKWKKKKERQNQESSASMMFRSNAPVVPNVEEVVFQMPPDPWNVSINDLAVLHHEPMEEGKGNYRRHSDCVSKDAQEKAKRSTSSSSSWKSSWLFRPLSKKEVKREELSSEEPPPKRRLKRSMSGPLERMSMHNTCGPIYSDGMPIGPANRSFKGRSKMGFLSGSVTPERIFSHHKHRGNDSPYHLLKSSSPRSSVYPIYTV